MILVITNQTDLFAEIKIYFPDLIGWRQLPLSKVAQMIDSDVEDGIPTHIFIDLTENSQNADQNIAEVLSKNTLLKNIPRIALIDHPDQRQRASEIGAVDYMLWPFCPGLDDIKLQNTIQFHVDRVNLIDEMQTSLTQDAFVGLIARMISEELDIKNIISRTVEQTIQLLHAASGAIWLLEPDKQHIKLAVSVISDLDFSPPERIPLGKGIIGWVADHKKTISILDADAIADSRFDLVVDDFLKKMQTSFLIVPLQHHGENIGVMAICSRAGTRFNQREVILNETIADLASSAIVNARLMDELRDSAAQQQALYEMSQHVAGGLNLQTTLKRSLQWASRLCETECGIFWSIDLESKTLHPIASIGVSITPNQQMNCQIEQFPFEQTYRTGQTVVYNKLESETDFREKMVQRLNIAAENIIVIPMRYLGELTGFLALINKIGDDFTLGDEILLSTAGEMMGGVVGNARMHAQLLTVMDEREQLARQAIHKERLATVGRLTASLSHEINNPMQAIRGALTLALEDIKDVDEVEMFIQMSLKETDRVVQLVNRMRQVYRPKQDQPENLSINELLQEVGSIATKEFHRQDVDFQMVLTQNSATLFGIGNQLHLVFLSILLNFSDSIGELGGGKITLQTDISNSFVSVSLVASAKTSMDTSWLHTFERGIPPKETSLSFISSISHDIIIAHEGTIRLHHSKNEIVLTIQFPIINKS